VPKNRPENQLHINEASRDNSKALDSSGICGNLLDNRGTPFNGSKENKGGRKCEERLSKACVDNRQRLREQSHSEAAKDTLNNDPTKSNNPKPT